MSPLDLLRPFPAWLIALVLFFGGCAGLTSTTMYGPQVSDPVQLSPNLQPLNDPAAAEGIDDRGIAVYGYRGALPRTTFEPPRTIYTPPKTIEQLAGPQFVPDGKPATNSILLEVTADRQMQIGSGAMFDLTVRNSGRVPLANVVVEAEFDEALSFPGHPEKRIRRTLGSMAAGESRDVSVMLTSAVTGMHCATFTATADGVAPAQEKACVDYIDDELEVSILAPEVRTVGSRAEFTVKLMNRALHELTGIELAITHDTALEPREGSAGAKFGKQRLSWDLDSLKPGEFIQVQVEFECVAAVEETCLIADVGSNELPDERKARCLRINEQLGPIQVDLRDVTDPLPVGEVTEHVVTITNRSFEAVGNIAVVARVPVELDVTGTKAEVDGSRIELPSEIDVDRVVFRRLEQLAAGATLTIRIASKTLQVGDPSFAVRVMFGEDDNVLAVTEPMSINVR